MLVGALTMIATLAVVSALPVLNLLSLGYFLEASGRIARSGRFRDGWIGLREFAVLGRCLVAIWLWILPLRLLHSFWVDAELIAPGGAAGRRLQFVLVLAILLVGFHLVWALLRGGRWSHFVWPAPLRFLRWIGSGRDRRESFDLCGRLERIWSTLQIRHFFKLGALGFVGAAIWLAPPVFIMMAAAQVRETGIGAIGALLGGLLLGLVVLKVPLLQTRFAATGRFRAFFDLQSLREALRHAPLALWLALAVSLLFAIPLYLLKIELTPDEIAWLPNLFFVVLIFPGRILLGWCHFRAERQQQPRHWASRWLARLALVPVAAIYVFIVWLTQYLTWHGTLGLLEQHAFLVPAPMLGL